MPRPHVADWIGATILCAFAMLLEGTKAVEVFSLDLRTYRSTRSDGPTRRR